MPQSATPTWAGPLWWATEPDRVAVTGNQFIERWYARMPQPKPPKNACVPELAGWSGLLGARPWVQARYRSRPAELARGSGLRNIELNEPESWNAVTRLYGDYTDPLARFSGGYAAVVDELRPRGLPDEEYGWVRPLKNRVPRIVRSVMAGPAEGPLGGVIEAADSADRFLAADNCHEHYERVAGRGYLSVLLERLERLRDTGDPDETVTGVLAATIARHIPVYGEPDQPARKPTVAERERAHRMLTDAIAEDPSVRKLPNFGEAYLRATNTLLCWIVQGRENIDGRILFRTLDWVRRDELRRQRRISERETALPDDLPALPGTTDAPRDPAADVSARLLRAHMVLLAHVEADVPVGDHSWEKTLALGLLSEGNAIALVAFASLAELVAAAWQEAASCPGCRPPAACTEDARTAARYVQLLLAVALSEHEQGPNRATERFARRLAKVVGVNGRTEGTRT